MVQTPEKVGIQTANKDIKVRTPRRPGIFRKLANLIQEAAGNMDAGAASRQALADRHPEKLTEQGFRTY